jgi:hypothetical protein
VVIILKFAQQQKIAKKAPKVKDFNSNKESWPSFRPVGPTARREDHVFNVGINRPPGLRSNKLHQFSKNHIHL